MEHWLKETFGRSHTSLCLLGRGSKVHFQNQSCKRLCGDLAGQSCPRTCILSCEKELGRPLNEEGLQFFPDKKLGKQFFDAIFFGSKPFRMVLLYPLQRHYEVWYERFRQRALSRREMEVAVLLLRGFPNAKIREKLLVSRSTLKTHLNNIYRKMPEARSRSWKRAPAP